VSVLLRHAGGFESSLPARKELDTHGRAVVERPKMCAEVADLDSVAAPNTHMEDFEQLIGTDLDDLLLLPGDALPGIKGVQDARSKLITTAKDALDQAARTEARLRPIAFDLWMQVPQYGISVSPVEGFVDTPNDLDVLPRHRPRSIPHASSPRVSPAPPPEGRKHLGPPGPGRSIAHAPVGQVGGGLLSAPATPHHRRPLADTQARSARRWEGWLTLLTEFLTKLGVDRFTKRTWAGLHNPAARGAVNLLA
jgi:hypothetical protein